MADDGGVAAMLLRENRADIDFERLLPTVASHGLAAGFREIWNDAFPGEAQPVMT